MKTLSSKAGLRKVYSYVRMSTKVQAKTEKDSFERQKSLAVEFCNKHKKDGYVLDTSLDLHDMGRSGWTGDNIHRGRLGNFLELIEAGKIPKGSILAIESFDRLSRQAIGKTLSVMLQIVGKGVDIVTLKDEKVWNEDTINDMGDLVYSLALISQANQSSDEKSRWLKSAWKRKRSNAKEKPLTAICPSWLTFNKKTNKFDVIPSSLKTVRRIFELSKNGMGNETIAKLFNAEGESPIGLRAKSWHASVVARILINRAVLGEFQPHIYTTRTHRVPDGEPIKGYYPKIISEQLFNVVRYRQKNRRIAGAGRRGKVVRNLFSHIAKCGFCDATMVSVQKDPRYPEIVCDHARRGIGCRYVSYPYREFETSFLSFVTELNLRSILKPSTGRDSLSEEIEQCNAQIERIITKVTNLTDAIADAENKTLLEPLRKRIEALQTERMETEKRQKELLIKEANETTPVQKFEDLQNLVSKAQDTCGSNANEVRLALKEAIRGCVEKIRVWPYEIIKPRPELMSWTEKRQITKAGWSITSDVQRKERGYWVYFKNGPETRLVYSHPKHMLYGSQKLAWGGEAIKKTTQAK
ncbi:MAG TPA: recombinase family protein [Verrucomicrobiae bacterium]|nr:recombinase family protein [Verrucomicrobiae bacterium]